MKLQHDKVLHFCTGLILCLIVGVLTTPAMGLLLGVIAGIIKEIYDKYNNGTVDVLDSLATTLGALVGFYILYF